MARGRLRAPAVLVAVVALGVLAAGVVLSLSCSRSRTPAKPNVILIVVDALRPDYLGCYGYDRSTSPTIDRLAAEGALFENAISQASWTKPSFASFLTSLYPFQHGANDWEAVMADTITTLPEVLRSYGYHTMAVINMLGITGEFQVAQGFDEESLVDSLEVRAFAKRKRSAAEATATAVRMMKAAPRPFFILIHYWDMHGPLRPGPGQFDAIRRDGDPDIFSGKSAPSWTDGVALDDVALAIERVRYAACLRGVDDAIASLGRYLDESGLARETMMVVTADHGEGFMEHGLTAHGYGVYDELVRVPLVIHYPAGIGGAKRIPNQVRHIDLLPTIVDYVGARDDAHREGVSLRPLIETRGAAPAPGQFLPADHQLCECSILRAPDTKCIRTLEHKLIVEPSTGTHEFYDLRRDPGERVNVWSEGGAVAESLEAMLARVPGSSVRGWRLAFGNMPEGSKVEVDVKVAGGGRVGRFRKVVGAAPLVVEVTPDSAGLKVTSEASPLQMLIFDTELPGAAVELRVAVAGPGSAREIGTGRSGMVAVGERLVLEPAQTAGLPDDFGRLRAGRAPYIRVWWLPGQEMVGGGQRAPLSPQDARRLRALGYIQ